MSKNKISKTKGTFVALLILLPIAISAIPMTLNLLLVKAASSATITLDVTQGYVGDI